MSKVVNAQAVWMLTPMHMKDIAVVARTIMAAVDQQPMVTVQQMPSPLYQLPFIPVLSRKKVLFSTPEQWMTKVKAFPKRRMVMAIHKIDKILIGEWSVKTQFWTDHDTNLERQ